MMTLPYLSLLLLFLSHLLFSMNTQTSSFNLFNSFWIHRFGIIGYADHSLSHYHCIERITRSIPGSFRLNGRSNVSISAAHDQRRMCRPLFRCINNYERWWWKVFVLVNICLYLYLAGVIYPLRIATKLWCLIYSLSNAIRGHKMDGGSLDSRGAPLPPSFPFWKQGGSGDIVVMNFRARASRKGALTYI